MLRLGSVLTLLFVTALPAQAESVADRVAAILVSQRSPERPTQDALVNALVPLGPELLAPAFEVLALRTVPVEGQDPQVLSEPQRDVLLATFEALGHAPVASAEQAWRPGRKDLDTLCARLWIYGAIGTALDFDALLAFANETDEGDRRRVEPALRHALTATLTRDPRALDRFARTWTTLRADLVSTAVVAIGSTHDARGVDVLRQVLSARPDQATTVMSQLRLLGPSPSAEVNATLAQMLRQELNPTDPQRCAAAAIALAVLEDLESVPILVSLLESESEGVKRDCAWALGQLTGMRFPAHAALWQRWLEAEQEWSQNGMHEALFRLRSVDPGQIAASIRELSSHRLYRHELSTELAKLLGSRNANLRRVACTGIQQLGSRQALPLLAAVLDDQNPEVARAARLAIASIAEIDVDDPEELATVLASARR